MNADQWKQAEALFHAALEREEEERIAFLQEKCGADEELFRAVESLLRHAGGPDPLLPSAVPAIARRLLDSESLQPGHLLGPYEIEEHVATGGMGVVYRARDTRLDRRVAIKILRPWVLGPETRDRLRREAQAIAKLQHPHICALFDIGAHAGLEYLVMEYLEGETLGARLERGPLPFRDALRYAVECAGALEQAHRRNLVHRDVKPGNIMITKAGIKLLDFGIASRRLVAEGSSELIGGARPSAFTNTGALAGTLPYMAPEQLTGKPVDARTDIFSFGLVLYEMLSGRRAFSQSDGEALVHAILQEPVPPLASMQGQIPAELERIVAACLAKDPDERWQNAGDLKRELAWIASRIEADTPKPLAAVLAQGETPSPDVVAEAGSHSALRPASAVCVLAGIAVILAILYFWTPRIKMIGQLRLENPPEVLAARVREITRSLGYTERPENVGWGFRNEDGYVSYMETKISGAERWRQALATPPFPVSFWYRQGPVRTERIALGGTVRQDDPFPHLPGTVSVVVDLDGRLVQFACLPSKVGTSPGAGESLNWPLLFAAARLDYSKFTKTQAQNPLPLAADVQMAWTGEYPGRPDLPIRVEAGALGGQIVYFNIGWPWNRSGRAEPASRSMALPGIRSVAGILTLVAAFWLARYNLKSGRSDSAGTWRIGVYIFVTTLLFWVLGAHTDPRESAWPLPLALVRAVYAGVISAALYLAVEPWLRRHWPQLMIAWSCVLTGRWRDPLVGRDILWGILAGLSCSLLTLSYEWALIRSGSVPFRGSPDKMVSTIEDSAIAALMGPQFVARALAIYLSYALLAGMALFLTLVLLRALFCNQWIAAVVLVAFWGVVLNASEAHWALSLGFWLLLMCILTAVQLRLGLLATVVTIFIANGGTQALITTDLTAWYAHGSLAFLVLLCALSLWAFHVSLGSKARWSEKFLERS